MNIIKKLLVVATAILISACASSHVLVGTARAPIAAEDVKIYLTPPAKYEEVALLEASSEGSVAITSRGKVNKVVERLKAEAAALGANGIILQGTRSEYGGSVNTGTANATVSGNSVYGTGFGTSAAIVHKAGTAIAIYVPTE